MKDRSPQEIEDFIYKTWDWEKPDPKKERSWRDKSFDPSITINGHGVRIRLAGMYDPPGFTFTQMMALAEFFETDNIKDVDRWKTEGCETCDYGSVAEFTVEIKPGNWPIKSQS